LTVDALTADGQFLGGIIAPGPDLMRKSLYEGTAGVREFSGPVEDFPVSTGAAVAEGIAQAQAGAVAGLRARLARHCGNSVTVVLSGGARALVENLLPPPVVVIDDLVLEGLAWIAKDRAWDD
jgi:type III pantothenate kinase